MAVIGAIATGSLQLYISFLKDLELIFKFAASQESLPKNITTLISWNFFDILGTANHQDCCVSSRVLVLEFIDSKLCYGQDRFNSKKSQEVKILV